MPLSPDVLAFVRASLPAPPARVLEVGAGDGELAAELSRDGYEVVAIDPVGEPPVRAVALIDLDEPDGSFDAAVAVVSLHHVEPLEESLAKLASLVRDGGVLVVDELDVEELDERATAWWIARRRERGEEAPQTADELVAEMREHIHPVSTLYELLGRWFSLGPIARSSYLHRWQLDLELQSAEEELIALGELPATGARFVGTRL